MPDHAPAAPLLRALSPLPTGASYAAAGRFHSLAIRTDGTLWAWGSNGAGQLGDDTTDAHPRPVKLFRYQRWQSVSAGSTHSAAVRDDGTLWMWGGNESGQLGLPRMSSVPLPVL